MKSARVSYLWIGGLLISCGLAFIGCSGTPEIEEEQVNTNPGFFTTIYSSQPIEATLVFDLDSVLYYKDANSEEEIDGEFILNLPKPLAIPVEVRSRGITRKDLCEFPPLRVQIKKAAIAEHNWGDYRSYKLVTHCSDSLRDQELLFREYLVYKLYEKLTNISLRTQLLQVHYKMMGDSIDRFAFLIENESEMNDRLGLKELDVEESGIKSIHFDHYKRFVLFQYMVGNTDWNLGTGHNTKYVLSEGSSTPIVIPYDFDYCGLVNASYARPYETLPIDDVRERYFMYRGKKDDDFSATVQEFLDLKDEWFAIVDGFPYMSDESKQDVHRFLQEFFTIIESPDWKDQLFPS